MMKELEVYKKVKVAIFTGYGINSDNELAAAFRRTGATVDMVHITDLLNGKAKLEDYQIVAFPGGFSFSDYIASGKVLAEMMKGKLQDDFEVYINEGKLGIGICNGFQALVKWGILPGFDGKYGEQTVTLRYNDSGRFEDRWVHLKFEPGSSIFTEGIDKMYTVVRHGEGKFVADEETLGRLVAQNQIVARYVDEDSRPANGKYPINPNGSMDDIAAVSNEPGTWMGEMPHPEATKMPWNNTDFTRKKDKLRRGGKKMPREEENKIFMNPVEYALAKLV